MEEVKFAKSNCMAPQECGMHTYLKSYATSKGGVQTTPTAVVTFCADFPFGSAVGKMNKSILEPKNVVYVSPHRNLWLLSNFLLSFYEALGLVSHSVINWIGALI